MFLCAGIVAGWLGGKSEVDGVDDYTRDLITESIRLYEAAGRSNKVAEAQSELAQCYWRAGDNETARILLTTALEKLTTGSPARANALLILSSVEWAEARYNEVLKILTLNATLFERSTNHTIRGAYHNQLGITLRAIGAKKTRTNYFQRAKEQYHAADEELRLAKHLAFRAMVKNNLAFVLRELGQLDEAYQCLEQARRLLMRVGDRVKVANVDDSRAQVLIAQKKYSLAEPIARSAARTFKRAGRQCFLAEALINQGIALARLQQPVRAQFIFQEAIEIAHQQRKKARRPQKWRNLHLRSSRENTHLYGTLNGLLVPSRGQGRRYRIPTVAPLISCVVLSRREVVEFMDSAKRPLSNRLRS